MVDIIALQKMLSYRQKEERFFYSIKFIDFDWSRAVFTGWNTVYGVQMWACINRFGDYSLRLFPDGVTNAQYNAILNEKILPTRNLNEEFIFMEHANKLSKSNLSLSWREAHPEVIFSQWPKKTDDIDPMNDVWANLNNRLDDDMLDHPASIYGHFRDVRDDFDNFNLIYNGFETRLEQIIHYCFGDYAN